MANLMIYLAVLIDLMTILQYYVYSYRNQSPLIRSLTWHPLRSFS